MFKKLLSSALFTIAIDKKARKKIKTLNEKKFTARTRTIDNKQETSSSRLQAIAEPPPFSSPFQSVNTGTSLQSRNIIDPEALLKRCLIEPKQNLDRKPRKNADKFSKAGRRGALIKNAMAIRRSKLHILDELDPEQLNKLATIASQALNLRIQK